MNRVRTCVDIFKHGDMASSDRPTSFRYIPFNFVWSCWVKVFYKLLPEYTTAA